MDKKTWRDLVRDYFPDADDRFCDFILWERTPFPFVTDVGEIECFIKKEREKHVSRRIP
jgi:hypothetical protein